MTDSGQTASNPTRETDAEREASGRANIAINNPRCDHMSPLLHLSDVSHGPGRKSWLAVICASAIVVFCAPWMRAQDNPLDKVHVPPPSTSSPGSGTGAPAGVDAPAPSGADSGKAKPGSMIRMNVDMVLVPVTVTDPMNRLVTGLEQEDFQVYENNGEQRIKSFAAEDAPVSIGIIFDLSGSMTSKLT